MWVKIYLEQNENYSLGDSISDTSERLLQKVRSSLSRDVILVKEECMQSGTHIYVFMCILLFSFFQKGIASHKELVISMKDFSVLLDTRRCKNRAHKIFPWKISKYLKICLGKFSLSTQCLISALHSELLSGGYWKPAAAATHDLILRELDAKRRFVVHREYERILKFQLQHQSL